MMRPLTATIFAVDDGIAQEIGKRRRSLRSARSSEALAEFFSSSFLPSAQPSLRPTSSFKYTLSPSLTVSRAQFSSLSNYLHCKVIDRGRGCSSSRVSPKAFHPYEARGTYSHEITSVRYSYPKTLSAAKSRPQTDRHTDKE